MSPVHSIQTMSDSEIKTLFAQAKNHIKDVHSIGPDHEDFGKFLNMHPFYRDAVDEYKKRGFDKPPDATNQKTGPEQTSEPGPSDEKPTTLEEIQEGCKLTPEEIEEGKKNLAQTEVPESTGSTVPPVTDHEQGEGQE